MDAAFGASVAVPLPQARKNTDRQLEYVRRSMRYLPGLAQLKTELVRSRRAVDLSFATPASARAAGFQTALNFTDVLESATTLEESVTSQLVQGQGSVPHSVVFAAAQLREVSDVMVAAAREGDLLYQIFVAPDSRFHALTHQLDTIRGAYETAADDLPPNLSPALARAVSGSGERRRTGEVSGCRRAMGRR